MTMVISPNTLRITGTPVVLSDHKNSHAAIPRFMLPRVLEQLQADTAQRFPVLVQVKTA